MNRMTFFLLIIILLFTFLSCQPDLTVKELEISWDAGNKKAKAEIANIGNKDAGNFMVYFNGDEDPRSLNHQPQIRQNVPSLAKGSSIIIEADFAPLSHPDNNNLGNVYKITVTADPKEMVAESNESNNVKELPIM